MKAFGIRNYSMAATLVPLDRADPPPPPPGHVQVRLIATSINRIDRCIAHGYGAPVFNPWRRFPLVLGRDGVGVVTAAGAGARGVRVGERVILAVSPRTLGTYAERVNVPIRCVSAITDRVADEDAAVLGYAGSMAAQALDALDIGPGGRRARRLVINGMGGGVGAIAAQLAASWGVAVTSVCSHHSHAWARSLGVEATVDRADRDATSRLRADAVLNCEPSPATGDAFRDSLIEALNPEAPNPSYVTLASPLFGMMSEHGTLLGAAGGLGDFVRRFLRYGRVRYRWLAFREGARSLKRVADFFGGPSARSITAKRLSLAALPEVFSDPAPAGAPGKICFVV